MKFVVLTFVLFLVFSLPSFAAGTQLIRISQNDWNHDTIELLTLVFDATISDFGPYDIKLSEPMNQGRAVEEVALGRHADVVQITTDKAREVKLLPIRIPLEKGLQGYRVCLIRPEQQANFSRIKNLRDAQENITLGTVTHWPDAHVAIANGISTVNSLSFESLTRMIQKQRFNCLARSVLEVAPSQAHYEADNLVIEKDILFRYPLVSYFFVSRQNQDLAKRIELGLTKLKASGKFDLFQDEQIKKSLNSLNLLGRRVIDLENPSLSPETQLLLENKSLWYQLDI